MTALAVVRKPDGKKPLVRPRRRWKDVRMDLREAGWEGVWTGCIWLRIGTRGGLF